MSGKHLPRERKKSTQKRKEEAKRRQKMLSLHVNPSRW